MLRAIKLKKSDFQFYPNTPGVLSKVAVYEVPVGRALAVLNDSPAYLKIVAKEVINAQITSDPFTLQLSHIPAPSDVPGQQGYAIAAGNRYEIVEIDPSSKQVKISGPTTDAAVDITVYYALGEGNLKLVVEIPAGSSVERRAVWSTSLMNLNSRNLYDENSQVVLPELLLLEEQELQLQVETQAQVDFDNDAAQLVIPAAIMDEEGLYLVLSELGMVR